MPSITGRRRAVGRHAATLGVAYAFFVTMLGTTLPTPLYPIYEVRFGFSELTVTVVFATYAVGVLVALLLLGQTSDEVGRRPMMFVGLALAAASSIVFLLAAALGPLLVGRFLSGLSAGIFTGTATAALVDFAPESAPDRGTLIAALVTVGGLGTGPLVAGLLAQFAPDPLRVPYAVHLGLLVPAALVILLMPESVKVRRGRASFRIQRLSVPREMRAIFIRAATASFAAFAVLGLFSAVAPSFLAKLLHLTSHWLPGVVVFLLLAASAVGQLALDLTTPEVALPLGSAVMVAGCGLIASGVATSALALLLAGAVVAGLGIGLAFRAGLTIVESKSPSTQRAEVASSFFVVSYVAISLPIVGIGVAAQAVGLRTAGVAFTGLVGVLALAVTVSLLQQRSAESSGRP
ncbi:MAG: MFS transporter [Solirubrobacteraceae bacterium]